MDDCRKYLDPDDLTPEERLERIVEILAQGVIRQIQKEKTGENPPPGETQDRQAVENSARAAPTPEEKYILGIRPGRVPFGQKLTETGRSLHESEWALIKQIQQLAAEGFSSEKIAKKLKEEDHLSRRAGKWSRTAVWRILQRLKEKGVTK
jgi:biotin operon repressor